MKKFALKATVAATALLASSLSMAALDLNNTVTPGIGGIYASEIVLATPSQPLAKGAAADQVATVKVGASLAADKQAYVRFDLTNGAKFKAGSTPTLTGKGGVSATGVQGAALTTSIAQGGAGESFVIFAVNPASTEFIKGDEVITLTGDDITVTNKNAVDLQYRLYETLTAAANPDNASSLALDSKSGTFLKFAPAVITTVTASATETADVGAINAGAAAPFTKFTGPSTTGTLGQVTIALATTPPALASGTAAALNTILHATDNLVTVTGDFSWVTASTLSNVTLGGANATSIAADKVTFKVTDSGVTNANIVATVNGTTAIPVGKYTTAVDLVARTTAVEPTDTAATNSGEIVRNGTTLKFPALSSGKNTTTYLQLVNTGALNAPMTTECFLSDGTTVAGLSATVPANTTYRNTLGNVCPTDTAKVQSAVLTLAVPSGNVNGTLMRKESTTGVMTYVNASAGNN